jgi:hypothetical protein
MYEDSDRTQIGAEEAAEMAAVKADPTVKSKLVTSTAAAGAALESWRADIPVSRDQYEPAENC